MQDEVNERSVALSMRGARMGAESLARTMRAFIASRQRHRIAMGSGSNANSKNGVMSLKALTALGCELERATVDDAGLKDLQKVLRRYHVQYSIVRDKSTAHPQWFVFFKAKDSALMEVAFAEFANRTLGREEPGEHDEPEKVQEQAEQSREAAKTKQQAQPRQPQADIEQPVKKQTPGKDKPQHRELDLADKAKKHARPDEPER